MNDDNRAALEDLLSVKQVSEITPAQVQQWQAAARAALRSADHGKKKADKD